MRFTVVVPTFNRAALLERALSALITARESARYACEIIVVDNNSTDATPEVAGRFGSSIRYVFESRQGLSYARNAGLAAAGRKASDHIIAFTDDDVEVAGDWLAVMAREFEANPGFACIGGRVLPRWNESVPPRWLTRAHWAPLALQDHGEGRRVFDESARLCLVGANVAFRSQIFDRIGEFSPHVQRIRDSVGSTEDHEILVRLYAAGERALYVPELMVWTDVPRARLTRRYHRRWHRGHGQFHARMRLLDLERSRGRVMDIPIHLFRSAAEDAVAWLPLALAGDRSRAFEREARLWFFTGFVRERCAWFPRR